MTIPRLMCLAVAAASVTGFTAPAHADFFTSIFDGLTANDGPARPAVGAWKTTVTREVTVAALDPNWTASVIAMTPSRITTGSIARVEQHDILPGPRITGHGHALTGVASFYGEDQMTATGERFDKRGLTAAHRTLPFGTRVRVTRVDTGDSVVVRINDRGPYKAGRVIDLSERAAEDMGMTGVGVTPVRLEVLGQ